MLHNLLPLLLLLPAPLTTALLIPRQNTSTTTPNTPCNNSPALCSKKYSEITHLGAHDSPFLRSGSGSDSGGIGGTGLSLAEAGNQNVPSTKQLDLGARLLSAQVHKKDGAWHLCHSSCDLLDAGTLSAWLGGIKSWLDAHTSEIVTILLVNSNNALPTDLDGEFTTAGIKDYGYVPTTPGTWPTLQEMIAANKRLVTFVNPITASASTPYLLNEFDYVFENSYNVTASTGFTCAPDRPDNVKGNTAVAVSSGKLPLMNHMLYTNMVLGSMSVQSPDFDAIKTTNAASGVGSLGDSANTCSKEWQKNPTFVLVDFVDMGDTVKVVDGLNDITAANGRVESIGGTETFTGDAGKSVSVPAKGAMGLVVGGVCALLMSC